MTLLSLLTLSLLAGCFDFEPPPIPPEPQEKVTAPHQDLDLDDVNACAACHAAVTTEWRESMHAQAHHSRDPIYGAMRTFRMGKEGEALGEKCNACHAPRAEGSEDSAAAVQGVSCATCHTTLGVTPGKEGAAALVPTPDGSLRGPHDLAPDVSPAHRNGPASPVIADGTTLCLACHAATQNAQGVASCTTGPEHSELPAGATCASCHMPRVAGPSGAASSRADHASHIFSGPHRAWYQQDVALLASALQVTGTWEGDALTVTVHNAAGHAFPTGYPGRVAALKLVGHDKTGTVVWSSFQDDPMTESPEALWNKVYVDAAGQPTMPPYAAELKADRRLKPDETRVLTFSPPAAVRSIEAMLVFRLLAPPAAQTLGLQDSPEAAPRLVKVADFTR